MTESDVLYVERITRRQSKSMLWHQVRTGRVTASKAHGVLHTNLERPAQPIIMGICKESSITASSVPALKWGNVNEKRALKDFEGILATMHENFKVHPFGFVICKESPFIGASPDGIFKCQCHHMTKLIEIKCPYSKTETQSIEEAFSDSTFFISQDRELEKHHKYYTQVQMQLHICQEKECDFVVWTPQWSFWTTVHLDEPFIKSSVSYFKSFYVSHVVPELLTRKIEQGLSRSAVRPQSSDQQ